MILSPEYTGVNQLTPAFTPKGAGFLFSYHQSKATPDQEWQRN